MGLRRMLDRATNHLANDLAKAGWFLGCARLVGPGRNSHIDGARLNALLGD
jgi:hypothetical protein